MIAMAKKNGEGKNNADGTPNIENINIFIDQFLEELHKKFFRGMTPREPITFGFNIQIGRDGIPIIENFNDVPSTSLLKRTELQVTATREPLADVIDRGEELVVIAEMPGISENAIEISFNGGSMDLHASENGRSYHKVVKLPYEIDPKDYYQRYNNGVLEITVRKSR